MLKTQLQALTMTASGSTEQVVVSLEEMAKPSIFDTDEMKGIKGIMVEVQEYINEIEYTKQNKTVLDKERTEAKAKQLAKAEENDVPEGFGKPQPNADQF